VVVGAQAANNSSKHLLRTANLLFSEVS